MLAPACRAAEALAGENVSVQVVNFPWLNRVDAHWLKSALDGFATVLILDDHLRDQGLGEKLAAALAEQGLADGRRIVRKGLTDTPLCGRNDEILAHYRFDPASLAEDIKRAISGASGNAI
jgi:transketolase